MRTHRFRSYVSHNLHNYLREIARRNKKEKQMKIGAYYHLAVQEFNKRHNNELYTGKASRHGEHDIQVPADFEEELETLRQIADRRRMPLFLVMEEAIKEYIGRADNYLGKDFIRGL